MSDQTNKLVGGHVPDRLFQLINLHCMVRNVSKTQVIRDSLLLWVEENNVDLSELIHDIRLELKAKWLRNKNNETSMSKRQWQEFQKDGFRHLNVSEQIIERIFEDFFNEKN